MMTKQEELMYQILGKISSTNAPIIFKGALITKLALAESNYNNLERATGDIDANWVGSPPAMSQLVDTINEALGELKDDLYAVATREYGDKKSAGISIVQKGTNEEVATMDIDMRPLGSGSRDYYFGETKIKGVLVDEILADKISVLSSNKIFRRAKDLVDVYALSQCSQVTTPEIFDICDKKGMEVGMFTAFIERRADLEHAYNKLRGIEGKPPFDEVYAHMEKFLSPFIERDLTKGWDSSTLQWASRHPELPTSVKEQTEFGSDGQRSGVTEKNISQVGDSFDRKSATPDITKASLKKPKL